MIPMRPQGFETTVRTSSKMEATLPLILVTTTSRSRQKGGAPSTYQAKRSSIVLQANQAQARLLIC